MTQFLIFPSANVDSAGKITALTNAVLSQSNVITVSAGTYRVFATAETSVLFTPTGSNATPGPTIIVGSEDTQFLILPAVNFNASNDITSLTGGFVTSNLSVTGLLSNVPYRAVTLTAPSGVVNTVTVPDAFLDSQWNVTDAQTGGILSFSFATMPYDGGSPLTNIYIYQNGSPTPIPTGLTGPGNFSLSGLTNGQSYSHTAAPVNAVGPAAPSPAKVRTPTAPSTSPDALVDGLATGATPRGIQVPISGMKVVGIDPLPAGISFGADNVTFNSFTGHFDDPRGWDFGDRLIIVNSRVQSFRNVYSLNQRPRLLSQSPTGSSPGMRINPGGGIDLMEFFTSEGSLAPMVIKQESGGFLGIVRRNHLFNMGQDAIKVTGTNIIEENMLGSCAFIGGTPHTDALTCMAAQGGIVFRNNYVDWSYNNTTDQSGINNWFRFESYAAGNIFDNIDIYGNRLHQTNSNSFAIQVDGKNSPVWNGSIRFNNNRMLKAGTLNKILYAPSIRISEWNNNINMATGNVIPLSAT